MMTGLFRLIRLFLRCGSGAIGDYASYSTPNVTDMM